MMDILDFVQRVQDGRDLDFDPQSVTDAHLVTLAAVYADKCYASKDSVKCLSQYQGELSVLWDKYPVLLYRMLDILTEEQERRAQAKCNTV